MNLHSRRLAWIPLLCSLVFLSACTIRPIQRPPGEPAPAAPEAAPAPPQGRVVFTHLDPAQGTRLVLVELEGDTVTPYEFGFVDAVMAMPVWSPDGSHIAFYGLVGGTEEMLILAFGADGQFHSLSGEQGVRAFGAPLRWTPEGDALLYSGPQPDGSEMDIYRVELDGSGITNLTAGSPAWDHSPSVSTQGRIAFASDRAPAGAGADKGFDNIWTMAADGSGLDQVTDTTAAGWENVKPAWSPDGTQIAFFRWGLFGEPEQGPSGLWVVDADGSNPRNVVAIDGLLSNLDQPVWSPDGAWIAYQTPSQGEGEAPQVDLYVVAAAGGEPILIGGDEGSEAWPSWSRDSEQLVYTWMGEQEGRVYLARRDGSQRTDLYGNGMAIWGNWAPASSAEWQLPE